MARAGLIELGPGVAVAPGRIIAVVSAGDRGLSKPVRAVIYLETGKTIDVDKSYEDVVKLLSDHDGRWNG